MHVHDLTWMQLEEYLRGDDRVVLPLGCTEQHAYLSLGTDTINVERLAVEAAEPLGVPVLPALPYGLIPQFTAYPGTVTLREETYVALLRDLLDALHAQGFRRIFVLNGHIGNAVAAPVAEAWQEERPDAQALVHGWWESPATWRMLGEPPGGHASWVESFPWTRVAEPPAEPKPMLAFDETAPADPALVREQLGDGSSGGPYQLPDEHTMRLWAQAVADARAALDSGWR
jgi:creatinine amidohydrolase